jgi:polysaccharide deacetylase family protein (PEP-CTERM system associated)
MNILTFDLEDWFHILDHQAIASSASWDGMESRVERNTDRILSVLEEKGIRSTWFCLGWIAKKYPSLIRKISEKHDLACHSMEHKLIFRQSREEVREDILQNVHLLENLSGKKVYAYRAPGFSFTAETQWLPALLAEAGIVYDCSIFPAKRNHGGYANFPSSKPCRISSGNHIIKEFPMTTYTLAGKDLVFSGGGYFRFLPYFFIDLLMKKSDYVMTYFHPRDFDSGQPVIKSLPLKRKFMSYVGLKNSFVKFNRLLNDHTFISLEEAGNRIDWNSTPLIKFDKI